MDRAEIFARDACCASFYERDFPIFPIFLLTTTEIAGFLFHCRVLGGSFSASGKTNVNDGDIIPWLARFGELPRFVVILPDRFLAADPCGVILENVRYLLAIASSTFRSDIAHSCFFCNIWSAHHEIVKCVQSTIPPALPLNFGVYSFAKTASNYPRT